MGHRLTECCIKFWIKMKNTSQHPLKQKWTVPIDNGGKFRFWHKWLTLRTLKMVLSFQTARAKENSKTSVRHYSPTFLYFSYLGWRWHPPALVSLNASLANVPSEGSSRLLWKFYLHGCLIHWCFEVQLWDILQIQYTHLYIVLHLLVIFWFTFGLFLYFICL